jgi:amphi-Trp domain-containing protein
MPDVKVEHKRGMTRAEVSEWIAGVGKALSGEGTLSIRLADTTMDVNVPEHVRVEVEIEVGGDEVELEIELKWSTTRTVATTAHKNGTAGA